MGCVGGVGKQDMDVLNFIKKNKRCSKQDVKDAFPTMDDGLDGPINKLLDCDLIAWARGKAGWVLVAL